MNDLTLNLRLYLRVGDEFLIIAYYKGNNAHLGWVCSNLITDASLFEILTELEYDFLFFG